MFHHHAVAGAAADAADAVAGAEGDGVVVAELGAGLGEQQVEALAAGKTIERIYLQKGQRNTVTADITELARKAHVPIASVPVEKLAPGEARAAPETDDRFV